MNNSEKEIYGQIAQLLFKAADKVSPDDKATIDFIGRIADALIPFDSDYEEKHDLGVMHEISEWIGLKLDAPEMADNYSKGIKEGYPGVFDSKDKSS